MSQMSEESENRNLQVQQIEENLTTIKNCSEYLQKRYENIKQIYEEIKTKDIESEGYQCGIQEILKLSKSTYKKAKKKLETLNITVSKESEPCTSEKLLTNSETSDLSIIESETNVNSLKGDSQIVTTEPSINQEDMGSILSRNTLQCDNQKESTDNDPDTSCAQHNGSEGIPSVDATLEPKSNSIPAIDADAQPTSAAASVSRSVSAESLKTFPTNVNENGNINSELEKNTTTTNNNNPPKGTIRLVSLEKLLDPKIASLQKRNSRKTSQIPDPNDSVIILDSDEDNDQVVKTTSENATRSKKTASKPESRISVSTKEDRLNTDVNINNRQRKIKRSAVRIKSNKLIDKMIAEGKNTIKVTPKYMGRIDSLVDEDLFKKLTSRDTSKRKREILVKKKTTERRTVELSVSSPEDDCNDDGKKESNGTVKKGIKIRIRRFSVTSNMSKDKDPDNSSNKNENNSDSEDDNITSRNVTPNGSSEKCGNEEKNSHTEETANHEKSNASESSDGEIVRKKPKRTKASSSSEIEKSTKDDDLTKKSKKRKRIKQASSDTSGSEKENANTTRKNIRKVLKIKDLGDITKKAAEEEASRRKRIEERQKLYNQIYEQPEAVELKELVLDFDETTKEPILSVDPGILKKLKPHQAGGIKFMWDACFETLKDTKEKSGSGCILAHCMGLGKTLQVVTLIHTLMTNSEKTNVERALVITPLSTVTNWAKEFKMWMRFCKNKNIEIYDMSKWREKNLRVSKTNEWFEEGGVCIMGYDMFRTLVNVKSATLKKKQRDILQKCLIEPGPDIVICDEGHLLKNEKTSLSQAVNRITTKRRIVLTGTPLQNNLKEYYCMIQFIKPNLLGTYKEYLNRFVNPITNGQYTDSTERDIKLMRHRSHVLHKLLEGCIQRKDYSVLAPYLPPKYEYVIFITLSEIQKKLYKFYMTQQKDIISEAQYGGKGAMLFQDFQSLRRIWTHPLCLRMNSINVIRKKLEQEPSESEGSLADFVVHGDSTTPTPSDSSSSESDDDEKPKSENKTVSKRRTRLNPGAADIESEPDNIGPEVISDPSEWWKAFCQEEDLMNINNSPKLILLLEVLQNCEALGDKVLLFSQSLQSLDVIEHFLSLIDSKTHGNEIEGDVGDFTGSWTPGLDYFRLDGSCSVEAREEMCKRFNDTNNLRGRLFLISTRAGSLGINLVAANRVIIFDVSWNPSYDTQSIFRVYRFGQTKPSYIYRFITLGTMEQKVYERQVIKQATAKRVVDEQQIGRHYNQSDLLELYKYEVEPVQPREVPPLPKDRLFADILAKHENIIYKYHDHNSLLENEESEILSEEERKAAWAEYQEEKDRPAQQFTAYPRGPYNGPVTSNKTFGFRNDILLKLLNLMVKGDHPAITDEEAACLVPVYLHRFYDQMNNRNTEMYSQLVQLHRQLEVPQGQYFPQMAQYPTQGPPPMGGIHPMSLMNMQQNPYMNPTPHSNQSHVYEID